MALKCPGGPLRWKILISEKRVHWPPVLYILLSSSTKILFYGIRWRVGAQLSYVPSKRCEMKVPHTLMAATTTDTDTRSCPPAQWIFGHLSFPTVYGMPTSVWATIWSRVNMSSLIHIVAYISFGQFGKSLICAYISVIFWCIAMR